MPILKGNISGSIGSIPYNIPSKITSFRLTPTAGGTVTATVYISTDLGTSVQSVYKGAIPDGTTYVDNTEILLRENSTIILVVSGSTDYYFIIE